MSNEFPEELIAQLEGINDFLIVGDDGLPVGSLNLEQIQNDGANLAFQLAANAGDEAKTRATLREAIRHHGNDGIGYVLVNAIPLLVDDILGPSFDVMQSATRADPAPKWQKLEDSTNEPSTRISTTSQSSPLRLGGQRNPRTHPGIGLLHRGTVLAHLTADEARSMADRLHDLAEKIDNPEVLQNASPVTDVAPKLVLRRITAADGTEEPDLITTPAESE